MSQDSDQTRERIVTAAARLFYNEGIRATSVDAIAEKAGITKKTLYYHFRSKDDLIAAYLASRDQPTLELYARWFDQTPGSAADKIRGLFAEFARAADTARWKGCGFQRTAAELANTPGHPALKAGASHKKRFEAWLTDALAGQGVGEAKTIARSIVVLLDGAAAVMLVHRDRSYVEAAAEVATSLVAPSHAASMAARPQAGQRRP
jgi:AcrR family transcriptional regulator